MFGEFCPHPKSAKHEKPNRTLALPLSERPSERGVSPSPSEVERCLHHKRSPPKRAVHLFIEFERKKKEHCKAETKG